MKAAGIGTFGAFIVCAAHRQLTWDTIRDAGIATLKATAMVMWIFFGATMFVGFFILKGGQTFVSDSTLGTGLAAYGVLILMMVILFVLGMFLDWVGILLLTVPIFLPILKGLQFDGLIGLPGVASSNVPLWYGIIFMVNMQMAFLSPPFGYSLFYLKSVAPPQITMATIFRAAVPFLFLQAVGVGLCIVFPAITLWFCPKWYMWPIRSSIFDTASPDHLAFGSTLVELSAELRLTAAALAGGDLSQHQGGGELKQVYYLGEPSCGWIY
ncbi:TRAP transporter large permease subunit [Mesorhizobium sp. M0145]|uniref:TRAP transporter large permease subunit n=1 Tax=unclassified Mesorhizobium TaxID=325217 RepID=UPI003338F349